VDDGSPTYLRDHSADEYVRTFLSRGGTYKSNSTEPEQPDTPAVSMSFSGRNPAS